MSGILRLESLTKGNTLKQGDKTPLKYKLFDADGEKLNIAGKSAKVRLVYPDFLTIGYEKGGLTVAQDDTVTFTIDTIIPSKLYHVEIIVDDKFIFPSRADESKFTVDKSSLGTESSIIEIVGVDAVVRKAVDLINDDPSLIIDEDKLVTDIISNTGIGNINEYYKAFNDLKPKAEQSITKSSEALTKSQNALNVANGIDAKATNALSLSESADTLSKSVQEQFNQVIIDGDSSVEAAQARIDASGQTNPTLKARLDKEHNEVTTQLAQTAKQIDGIVNVKQFGAVGNANHYNKNDGLFYEDRNFTILSHDDTQAIQNAVDSVKQSGGQVYVPSGNYLITETIDYYMSNARGFTMYGDNMISSVLQWNGGNDKPMFSNEQSEPDKYQYGVFFRDLLFLGDGKVRGTSVDIDPSPKSIGLYIDMTRNEWGLHNVRFEGFDTGLIIGLHSEGGLISKCYFAYNRLGANAYGNQADNTVFHASWFGFNTRGGLIISSPRTTVDACFFGGSRGDETYRDIRIGYQALRPEDVGKSAFVRGGGGGGSGVHSRVVNSYFEISPQNNPSVELVNMDSTSTRISNITFENNSWALYESSWAVRISNESEHLTFRNNRVSSNDGVDAVLLDIPNNRFVGTINIQEPHISKLIPDDQYWRYVANKEDFDNLPQISNLTLQDGFLWQNSGINNGVQLVDLDFDGRQNIEVSHQAISNASTNITLRYTSMPEGDIFVKMGIGASDVYREVTVRASTGGGVALWQRPNIRIGKQVTDLTFGFNNPTTQTIIIVINVATKAITTQGKFVIFEPKIKHSNNLKLSNCLYDTNAETVFTRVNGQVHDFSYHVPFKDILNDNDLSEGAWYFGEHKFTTISDNSQSGTTTITVDNPANVKVGDYLYFKQSVENGVSSFFRGTSGVGNKVTSISSNTITLANGTPFDVVAGQKILACEVFRKSTSEKI